MTLHAGDIGRRNLIVFYRETTFLVRWYIWIVSDVKTRWSRKFCPRHYKYCALVRFGPKHYHPLAHANTPTQSDKRIAHIPNCDYNNIFYKTKKCKWLLLPIQYVHRVTNRDKTGAKTSNKKSNEIALAEWTTNVGTNFTHTTHNSSPLYKQISSHSVTFHFHSIFFSLI